MEKDIETDFSKKRARQARNLMALAGTAAVVATAVPMFSDPHTTWELVKGTAECAMFAGVAVNCAFNLRIPQIAFDYLNAKATNMIKNRSLLRKGRK